MQPRMMSTTFTVNRRSSLALVLCALLTVATLVALGPNVALAQGSTDATAANPTEADHGSVAGRFTLEVLSNVGGGLVGGLGGLVLGAPGGDVGMALGATGGLGIGILFIGPGFMCNTAESYGYDGSYGMGVVGGLVAGLSFTGIELALSENYAAEQSMGTRMIAYALLGPVIQALVFETSLKPMQREAAAPNTRKGIRTGMSPTASVTPDGSGGLVGVSGVF